MDRIQLHNGVEMPQEGFGVFQVPESVCKEVVLNAIRAGYRLIDTASSYKNEEAVGSAIREAVLEGTVTREELFITTKAYIQEMGYDNLKEAFARFSANWDLTISICIWFICRWVTTTARGEPWRNSIKREKSGLSAFAISTPPD